MHYNVYCRNISNHVSGGESTVNVYFGAAANLKGSLPLFLSLLSDNEKERAARFRFESDHNCYVAAHALLRIELSKLLGTNPGSVRIAETKKGKPYTADADQPFNLSRSGDQFAFVTGSRNQSLGIDIEQIKPTIDFIDISKRYFSYREQQFVSLSGETDDQNRTFYEIWTRKEALLKAIGIGIDTKLSNVSVMEGKNNMEISSSVAEADTYNISTLRRNGSFISIASSVDFIPLFYNLNNFF